MRVVRPQLWFPATDERRKVIVDGDLASTPAGILAVQDPLGAGCNKVRDIIVHPAHRAFGPTGYAVAQLEPATSLIRAELDQVGNASHFDGDPVDGATRSCVVCNLVIVTLGT